MCVCLCKHSITKDHSECKREVPIWHSVYVEADTLDDKHMLYIKQAESEEIFAREDFLHGKNAYQEVWVRLSHLFRSTSRHMQKDSDDSIAINRIIGILL